MQNQTFNGNTSPAVNPQIDYTDVITQLEQTLKSDAQKLMFLYQQGLVSDNQAQYFTNKLLDTRNKLNLLKQNVQEPAASPLQNAEEKISALELFRKEKPDFFEKSGRAEVLDYIKNFDMDKDDISQIANLIEVLEKAAVDCYLKQSEHDKTLNDENTAAKSKLTSYAQNAAYDSNNNKVFTRTDLGRMSGEEFAKNEKLIFDQVKRGLI